MPTPRQLSANRLNAAKSTGPRTAAGKATSRWNALKHGVLSQAIIPGALEPFESRQDFDALLSALCQDLQPQTALEEMLVERIATLHWRIGRVTRAEAGAVAARQSSVERDLRNAEIKQDPARNVFVAISNRFLPPTPTEQIRHVEKIIGDPDALRSYFGQENPEWLKASGEALVAHARKRLASLRATVQAERAQTTAEARARRGIPAIDQALLFSRYEASLDRDLHRALRALERLQGRRQEECVPPPIDDTATAPAADLPDTPEPSPSTKKYHFTKRTQFRHPQRGAVAVFHPET